VDKVRTIIEEGLDEVQAPEFDALGDLVDDSAGGNE